MPDKPTDLPALHFSGLELLFGAGETMVFVSRMPLSRAPDGAADPLSRALAEEARLRASSGSD